MSRPIPVCKTSCPDYDKEVNNLIALWHQSKKENERLYVGIDGQKPNDVVDGVKIRNRYGECVFKAGGVWYQLTGAPFTFRVGWA